VSPDDWRPLIAILVLFLVLYVAPLALRPLASPDEYRYGEVSREMIVSGDWIAPRLNGMPYFEKPVLGYWLIAAAILGTGESAFAIRLPSALATGATAAILFLLLRRFGGNRREAPLAAAAWLTTLLPFAIGITGILDAVFAFFVTATMAGLCFALHEERPGQRRWQLTGAGIAAGCAFLTKGPLGWILPAISLIPWLLIRGSLNRFLRLAWMPAALAAALVAPWAFAVHLRSDFWYRFIWVEHLQRFTEAGRDQHPAGPWYYAAYLIPAALPWIALVPAATRALWRRRREAGSSFALLVALWFGAPFVFLSASSGKLLTYILPCVPPLLILAILGASRLADGVSRPSELRWAAWLSAAAGGLLTVALLVERYRGQLVLNMLAQDRWGSVLLFAALAGWMVASLAGALARNGWATLRWLVATPLLLMLASHFLAGDGRLGNSPDALIRRNLERVGSRAVLVGDDTVAQALCWIAKRDDVHLFGSGGEMSYGLEQTAGRSALDPEGLSRLVEESDEPVLLAMLWARWEHYRRRFPQLVSEERDHRFVVIGFRPGRAASPPNGDPPLPARDAGADDRSLGQGLGRLGDESAQRRDPVAGLESTDDQALEARSRRDSLHLRVRGQHVVAAGGQT